MERTRSVAAPDRPTILVIEDEPTRRELVTDALVEAGFTVAHAGTVHDAVRQAHAVEPDLIIIDPRPTASVPRELNRLRSDAATRDLPVVVIRHAGATMDGDRVYAYPASPVNLDLLLQHVWRVINTGVLGMLNGYRRSESGVRGA